MQANAGTNGIAYHGERKPVSSMLRKGAMKGAIIVSACVLTSVPALAAQRAQAEPCTTAVQFGVHSRRNPEGPFQRIIMPVQINHLWTSIGHDGSYYIAVLMGAKTDAKNIDMFKVGAKNSYTKLDSKEKAALLGNKEIYKEISSRIELARTTPIKTIPLPPCRK